ncbi:hypothetical protein AK88_04981 [Plasmodium fragile]|uniref:Schizont-infected cell agglutination C-terminal domain-containing protein n=1 Tax=Plasmodium fragile TaxID=5857 RepID=A0A0D9QI33_PLAFR|nr:uncharacterized protein AK88_04981 [Plasmodium fragile]KJP85381.1 hypothetical protein AK88_04981 [Plasmodium fragile]
MEKFVTDVLAYWATKRGLWNQKHFDEILWKDMETVLRDFVRHIERTRHILDALAKSCENMGWDYKENDTAKYMGHTVGDVLKCRLMVGALYFMMDWHGAAGTGAERRHQNDDHFEGIMKCILVHVFERLLSESTCGDSKGIRYAWKIIDKMKMPGGFDERTSGGTCKRNQYGDTNIGKGDLKGAVKEWLRNNPTVAQQLEQLREHNACKRRWNKNMRIGDAMDDEDPKKEQVTQGVHIEGHWTDVVKNVFTTIANAGDKFKEELREHKTKASGSGATMNVPSAADDTDDDDDDEDDDDDDEDDDEEDDDHDEDAEEDANEKTPTKDKKSDQGSTGLQGTGGGRAGPAGPKGNKGDEGPERPAGAGSEDADKSASPSAPAAGSGGESGKVGQGPGTEHGGGGGPGAPGGGGGGGGSGSSSSSASEPSGSGSTGEHTPGSSGPGSTGTSQPGTSGTGSSGGPQGAGSPPSGAQTPETKDQPLPTLPPSKPFDPRGLIPYTPAIIPAVVGIGVIAFFLWKYFAYLGHKRRRKFRTVRDVPSPPLDEEILAHLQRGDAPPPDYGYTMVRDRRPTSATDRRRRRQPRVHKRTIIELHLEVLNECEATEWENVKHDYLQIVVEEIAQDLMRDANGHSSFTDAPTTNQALSGNNVASTVDPPTDIDATNRLPPNEHDHDPWKCMETIQLEQDTSPPNEEHRWSCMENIPLETDPSAPHEDDPDPCSCVENIQLATDPCQPNAEDRWNCMETIQLDTEPDPHSSPRNELHAPACTNWINWIDRHTHLLQECTTQPWFLQLKADWKQYLRDHMATNEDNEDHGVHGQRALGEAAILPMKKLDAWNGWVAKQHRQMRMYNAEEWFQHLLNNVEQQTASQKGEVPGVEYAMFAEHMLRVRNAQRTQLHPQLYMKKPLTAKTWILILALVIEQCEVECRLHDRELYVDDLLEKLCN